MRKSRQRVRNPVHADFFYVPIEGVNCVMPDPLNPDDDPMQLEACEAAAKEVVASMRAVGPYWDALRDKHLLPSEFCWHKGMLPDLWDAGAVELCLYANAATLNRSVFINVPWFTPDTEFDPTFYPPSERELLANFIGSASVN